jgi:hypothetical protein
VRNQTAPGQAQEETKQGGNEFERQDSAACDSGTIGACEGAAKQSGKQVQRHGGFSAMFYGDSLNFQEKH